MNTCAKRGSMSQANEPGMNWGKNRNHTAHQAAAAAPSRPQPRRDRRATSIAPLLAGPRIRTVGDRLRQGSYGNISRGSDRAEGVARNHPAVAHHLAWI